MRTFPDESASRPGMVYTVAFTGPIDQFSKIQNLQALVDRFPAELAKETNVAEAGLEVPDSELTVNRRKGIPPALARALVSNAATVVWGDPASFDDVIVKLWSMTWPTIRRNLSFRLSFDPNDIDERNAPTLVASPQQVRSRWIKNEFVSPSSETKAIGAAASVLTGDQAGQRIEQLRRDLDSNVGDFRQLELLQALAKTLDQPEQSLSSRRAQLQLAAKLSPDAARGSRVKLTIASDILKDIPRQNSAAEIRGLRNVPWESVDPEVSDVAFSEITSWVKRNAVAKALLGDSVGSLLSDALVSSDRWGQAVRAGFEAALSVDNCDTAVAVWSWLRGELRDHAELVLSKYVRNAAAEACLAEACPDLKGETTLRDQVLAFSKSKDHFDLHASVALTSFPAKKAIALHLAALPPDDVRGLDRCRMTIGNETFVALSVECADSRLIDSVIRSLMEAPVEWKNFTPEIAFWRSTLVEVLARHGIASIEECYRIPVLIKTIGFLVELSTPDDVAESLWRGLAKFQPNWSNLDLAADVWRRIPSAQRAVILDATAEGWLKKLASGDRSTATVPSDIRPFIADQARIRRILKGETNVSAMLELFEGFPELSEGNFVWWLRSVLRSLEGIARVTAIRIGELIAARRWRSAAEEFCRMAEPRLDLRAGMEQCLPFIGMVQRIHLFFAGVSQGSHALDAWLALQELGLQLYSYGPGANALWQRAGGNAADLPNFKSGREAWGTLISEARLGRHSVTLESLTNTMLEDYPNNADLKRIARLINERG